MEIAYVSSDRIHLELQSKKSGILGYIISLINKNPSLYLATTLVGNTIALTIYGSLMASAMEPHLSLYFNQIGTLLIQVLISTIVVLATAEFLPKSLFLIDPNKMVVTFAIPFFIIGVTLFLLVILVVWLTKLTITMVFKGQYSSQKPVYGLTDLNNFLKDIVSQREKHEEEAEINTQIFSNALDFKRVKIRECMIPRTEIIAIDSEASIEELKKAFIDSGYSKVLVYKETIDNIIGYCHSSHLFKKPKELSDIIQSLTIVPETKLANELMIEFIDTRKSIALVVDEFGGTSGIVTIEDVIEEIFGEIQDEHDDEDLVELQLNDQSFIFSARQEIDYLNEKYDLHLPEGDYDTLGGLILSTMGDIPSLNDQVELDSFLIIITSMDGVKIDKVKLVITDNEEKN
jgi:CBS domain containing-hemolysin-like protein